MKELPNDWFTIYDSNFQDGISGNFYVNFTGKFSVIRFKITTNSGSVDKILYRP
jgi:hypothetical protein